MPFFEGGEGGVAVWTFQKGPEPSQFLPWSYLYNTSKFTSR
jgi:hypothetical protein